MKNFFLAIINFIAIIGIALIILIISALIVDHEYQIQENEWNNGRCPKCGQEWRFEQAISHYNDTTYLYVCDNCLNTVELEKYHGN